MKSWMARGGMFLRQQKISLARGGEMLGQIVVGDLGQVLLQVADDDLGDRLAELVFQLGEDPRRGHEHELVELSPLPLGIELLGNELYEVLLGGVVQVAAR